MSIVGWVDKQNVVPNKILSSLQKEQHFDTDYKVDEL